MKRLCLIALCLLLALPLCGCWQEEPMEDASPVPLGTAPEPPRDASQNSQLPDRFSLPYEPDHTLDPIDCPDGMQQVVGSLLYEGLFRLDPRLEPELCLCDSYSHSEDFTFYTFVLRPGAAFSTGLPLTAEHVKTALDRARESRRYGARLRQIEEITAAGDTLFVTLSAPNSGLPALLDVPISTEREGGGVPLGTGPYYFAREDGGAWLIANPGWGQGNQPVERIFLEESQNALLYRFTSRDVQLIVADLTAASPAGFTGDIRYQDAAATSMQYFICNIDRDPLNRAEFRRALSLGIDRSRLVSGFLSGHALPAMFPVSPASPLYPADLEIAYTPFALSSALTDMGWSGGRTLVLLASAENTFKASIVQSVAETFEQAGISVETRILPWEEYLAALEARDFDLCYCETRLSADWDLTPLLASWGSLNYGGWYGQRTDSLLNAFAAASDRPAAMRALCELLRDQFPILPVCFTSSSVLTLPDVVEKLRPTAAEPFYNLTECVIHLSQEGE